MIPLIRISIVFDSTLSESSSISQQLNLIIRGYSTIDIISCHGNIPRTEIYLNNRDSELKERSVWGHDNTLKNVAGRPLTWIMGQNVNKQDRLEQLQEVVKMLLAFPVASTWKFHKFRLKGRDFYEFTTKEIYKEPV